MVYFWQLTRVRKERLSNESMNSKSERPVTLIELYHAISVSTSLNRLPHDCREAAQLLVKNFNSTHIANHIFQLKPIDIFPLLPFKVAHLKIKPEAGRFHLSHLWLFLM